MVVLVAVTVAALAKMPFEHLSIHLEYLWGPAETLVYVVIVITIIGRSQLVGAPIPIQAVLSNVMAHKLSEGVRKWTRIHSNLWD